MSPVYLHRSVYKLLSLVPSVLASLDMGSILEIICFFNCASYCI